MSWLCPNCGQFHDTTACPRSPPFYALPNNGFFRMPQIRINAGRVELSYDNGETWMDSGYALDDMPVLGPKAPERGEEWKE